MRCLTCIGGSCSKQGHPAHCAGRPKPIMFSLPQSRSGSICFANLHPSPDCSRSVPCYLCLTPVQRRKEIPFSSPCDRMARDGGRTTDLTRSSLGGAARTLPRRGKQRRARGSRARGSRARGSRARGSRARGSRAREVISVNPTPGEPQLPEAQPPENLNPPDFRSLEAPRPVSRFRQLPRWDIEPRTRPLSVVYVRSMQDEE